MRKAAPALLKSHKSDAIAILSTLEGTSPAAYAEALNILKLTKDFTELLTDDVFRELFISAQSESASGSASESTKDPAL